MPEILSEEDFFELVGSSPFKIIDFVESDKEENQTKQKITEIEILFNDENYFIPLKTITFLYPLDFDYLEYHEYYLRDKVIYTEQDIKNIERHKAFQKAWAEKQKYEFDTFIELNKNVKISIKDIIGQRFFVMGQSGSGKTNAVIEILEQMYEKGYPFFILDVEDEFSDMKKYFNKNLFVLDYDNIKGNYYKLMKKIISNPTPTILSIPLDKKDEYAKIIDAFWKAEDDLRVPFLLVVDEADYFIPESMKSNLSSSILKVFTKGRKRNLGVILVSQRPAMISKTALTQCGWGMVGKVFERNDINALSFVGENIELASNLKPGQFIPFNMNVKNIFKINLSTTFMKRPSKKIEPRKFKVIE